MSGRTWRCGSAGALAVGCLLVSLWIGFAGCASPGAGDTSGAAARSTPAQPAQPTAQQPPAAAEKPAAAQPQQLEQAVRQLTERPAGSEVSEAEREKLVELIQAAIQAQIEASQQQAPAAPAKPVAPAPAPKPEPAPTKESQAAQAPAGQEGTATKPAAQAQNKGCGGPTEPGPTLDLTPAPLDAPQPKYVCKESTKTNKSAWVGQSAEFEFEIANEGAAPLAIRLKGG